MVHDTLGGERVAVGPGGTVRIYVCGVTAYDDAHVGHARSAIVFDVMRRHLERGGARVELVQNFTDVDDKILARAAESGEDPAALAGRHMRTYVEDADSLNVLRPTAAPRASEHIGDMVEMVRELVASGAAYETPTGVYFDVSSFGAYGRLSGKPIGELLAGARVGVDATKRSALDFALWKRSGEARSWPSPWGRGRPGWHIECSAMARRHLGATVDVHGGGRDLIFPHHENEIAQSETCTGRALARAWVHVGMVTVNGEKMSKSAGNQVRVRDALREWGANALRVFCLGARYSKRIDYTPAAMSECAERWRQAETCHYELGRPAAGAGAPDHERWAAFAAALDSDMDTRGALGELFGLAGEANEAAARGEAGGDGARRAGEALAAMLSVLGLRVAEPGAAAAARLDELGALRERRRSESRWAEADAARDEMASLGADALDHGARTVWVYRERRALAGGPGR